MNFRPSTKAVCRSVSFRECFIMSWYMGFCYKSCTSQTRWQLEDSSRLPCKDIMTYYFLDHILPSEIYFVINLITCQGHSWDKGFNALSGWRCISIWICDKQRWGKKTRRNGIDIVLADKSRQHIQFCNSAHQNLLCSAAYSKQNEAIMWFISITIYCLFMLHSSANLLTFSVYSVLHRPYFIKLVSALIYL